MTLQFMSQTIVSAVVDMVSSSSFVVPAATYHRLWYLLQRIIYQILGPAHTSHAVANIL